MRFQDVALPQNVKGYPTTSAPRFNTQLVEVASGDESANELWSQALHVFKLPEAIRDHETFEDVRDQWLIMGGPARLFPFQDPLDFASVRLEAPNIVPTITGMDCLLGTGDGVKTHFQLRKSYTRGGVTYYREIQLPVVASVLLTINGVAPGVAPGGPFLYTVDREGGGIDFSIPIPAGRPVRAGFFFDVPVRFESDTQFEGIVKAYQLSAWADLTLIERRLC